MRFWPWKRNDKPDTKSICEWPLSAPLFYVSQWDAITLGDALENIWIFGGTGSGKTSTSGYLIAGTVMVLDGRVWSSDRPLCVLCP